MDHCRPTLAHRCRRRAVTSSMPYRWGNLHEFRNAARSTVRGHCRERSMQCASRLKPCTTFRHTVDYPQTGPKGFIRQELRKHDQTGSRACAEYQNPCTALDRFWHQFHRERIDEERLYGDMETGQLCDGSVGRGSTLVQHDISPDLKRHHDGKKSNVIQIAGAASRLCVTMAVATPSPVIATEASELQHICFLLSMTTYREILRQD